MRIFDLLRIAAKHLKGKWIALAVFGAAISMFCFCFAGAVMTSVFEEKSLPYTLSVVPGTSDLTDNNISEIKVIEDVTAATPILQVPGIVTSDEYTAQLTLTGIDATYLEETLRRGTVFLDSSIMPYIVLDEAALKLFVLEGTETTVETDVDEIDWLSTSVTITTGEGTRPVVSKIAGILAEDEEKQETAAYISLSSAKQLLQQSGQAADYEGAYVRIANIGCAESVSKAITALGLSVTNTNAELQSRWDGEMKEMTYLIVIGGFCLLCAAVLMAAWRKISLMNQKEAFSALQWTGMKEKEISRLFVIQSLMITLIGVGIGIIVSVSLPSFLSVELQGSSVFTLPISFWIVALCAVVCVIVSLVPLLGIRKDIVSELS